MSNAVMGKCARVQATGATNVGRPKHRKFAKKGNKSISSRKGARQDVKANAVPIFEIAEAYADEVATTVSETLNEAATTASDAAVDAYQASVNSAVESTVVTTAAADGGGAGLLLAGGAAVVLGGTAALVFSLLKPKEKSVSAAQAFDVLAETPQVKLVDLRSKVAVKEEGQPDLRSIGGRRKYVKMPVDPEEELDIGRFERLVEANEYVIFIDSYGGLSRDVARKFSELKADNVAYVADGTVGPSGWVNSEMPWRKPFAFGFPGVEEVVENYKENPTPANTAAAVLGGVGLLSFLFIEYEGAMEFLSFILGGSFLASKTLLAEDRETTERQIKQWLNTKKVPDDLVEEVEDFRGKVVGTPEERVQSRAETKKMEEAPVAVEEAVAKEGVAVVEQEQAVPEPEEEPEPEPEPEPEQVQPPGPTSRGGSTGDVLELMVKVTGESKYLEQK